MRFDLRYARDGFSVQAAIRKGRELPEWFLDAPELFPGDEFFLDAFWSLDTCRSVAFGIGPIPWTAIVEYADCMCLERAMVPGFVRLIRTMDAAYLEWHRKNRE